MALRAVRLEQLPALRHGLPRGWRLVGDGERRPGPLGSPAWRQRLQVCDHVPALARAQGGEGRHARAVQTVLDHPVEVGRRGQKAERRRAEFVDALPEITRLRLRPARHFTGAVRARTVALDAVAFVDLTAP